MKKFLFIIAALFVCGFSAIAQTTVNVNDSTMGYVERYPAYVYIEEDTLGVDFDTVFVTDSVITDITQDSTGVDTAWTVYDTTYIDTLYDIEYDTVWAEHYYDYRAFAYEGFQLDYWEVVTVYNQWYNYDDSRYIDSVYADTIVYYDNEIYDDEDTVYNEGWLVLDDGIPDLEECMADTAYDSRFDYISAINITAYFSSSSENSIDDATGYDYKVYPNPTTGTVNVSGNIDRIVVFDISGKIVIDTKNSTINMSNFASGLYFMNLKFAEGGSTTVKIIKK